MDRYRAKYFGDNIPELEGQAGWAEPDVFSGISGHLYEASWWFRPDDDQVYHDFCEGTPVLVGEEHLDIYIPGDGDVPPWAEDPDPITKDQDGNPIGSEDDLDYHWDNQWREPCSD